MKKVLFLILAVLILTVPVSAGTTLTKTIKTTTKTITVRKGQKLRLRVKGKKAKFVAKKTKIFAISKKGVLSAKKVGVGKFKYKLGKKTKTVKVIVKAVKASTPTTTVPTTPTKKPITVETSTEEDDPLVWRTATGKKYHVVNNCGTTNPANAKQIHLSEALAAGLTACSKCYGAAA